MPSTMVSYARTHRAVAHIGPPKTATTSLQGGLIPHLGRPYQIRPDWCRALARDTNFSPPSDLPPDIVVSDEMLGDFSALPPDVIASRMGNVFKDAIIVYVERDPLELFYSYYRQRLINSVRMFAKLIAAHGEDLFPNDANTFFNEQLERYRAATCGFFALIRFKANRAIFQKRFEVVSLPFSLLNEQPHAFVQAFSDICGRQSSVTLPRANQTDQSYMEKVLTHADPPLSEPVRAVFLERYMHSVLTPDREDMIRNWQFTVRADAFVNAFQFRKA